MKKSKDTTKKRNQGPGRPRENEKHIQPIKGITSEPSKYI